MKQTTPEKKKNSDLNIGSDEKILAISKTPEPESPSPADVDDLLYLKKKIAEELIEIQYLFPKTIELKESEGRPSI